MWMGICLAESCAVHNDISLLQVEMILKTGHESMRNGKYEVPSSPYLLPRSKLFLVLSTPWKPHN